MRQGDINLIPVDKLPTTAKKIKGTILAHGESGNIHVLKALSPEAKISLFKEVNEIFAKIEGEGVYMLHCPANMVAEEAQRIIDSMNKKIESGVDIHYSQPVKEGIYKMHIEEQEDPLTERIIQSTD